MFLRRMEAGLPGDESIEKVLMRGTALGAWFRVDVLITCGLGRFVIVDKEDMC